MIKARATRTNHQGQRRHPSASTGRRHDRARGVHNSFKATLDHGTRVASGRTSAIWSRFNQAVGLLTASCPRGPGERQAEPVAGDRGSGHQKSSGSHELSPEAMDTLKQAMVDQKAPLNALRRPGAGRRLTSTVASPASEHAIRWRIAWASIIATDGPGSSVRVA